MNDSQLEYLDREFLNFKDRSFRWVDVKRFRLAPGLTSPDSALAALLADIHYQDHYTSSDSHEKPTGDLHGPYRLEAITPDSFEPVDEEAALRTINEFADDEDMEPQLATDLANLIDSTIRALPLRYRLRDLGTESMHGFGFVLQNFHELVLINPTTSELALVVAAID